MLADDRAVVQRGGDGRFLPEMKEAHDELIRRGARVDTFIGKHLLQRRVPLDANVLVVGELPVVEAALRQLGPGPPDELRGFLRRRVWASTLGEVETQVLAGAELFVKPRGRIKRFTGRMVDSTGLGNLEGVSRRTPVWCSELVSFASEHRAFVVEGQVRDVRSYGGDESTPDRAEIDRCVATWSSSGRAAKGTRARVSEGTERVSARRRTFGRRGQASTVVSEVVASNNGGCGEF